MIVIIIFILLLLFKLTSLRKRNHVVKKKISSSVSTWCWQRSGFRRTQGLVTSWALGQGEELRALQQVVKASQWCGGVISMLRSERRRGLGRWSSLKGIRCLSVFLLSLFFIFIWEAQTAQQRGTNRLRKSFTDFSSNRETRLWFALKTLNFLAEVILDVFVKVREGPDPRAN